MSEEQKQERERIKELIEIKKQSIEVICKEKFKKSHRKRNLHTIAKSKVIKILDNIIFRIDYPAKNRGQVFESE